MMNEIGNSEIISSMHALKAGLSQQRPNAEFMFNQLSVDAGGDGSSINKDQLQSLIDKAKSGGRDTKDLDDLMSKFDKISNGADKIESSDFVSALEKGTLKQGPPPPPKPTSLDNSRWLFQDPSSITSEQLEPPIDIRV